MTASPRIERTGDSWLFAWDEAQVGMGIDRLRESSEGIHAELVVESIAAEHNGRLYGPVKLNVLSADSQTRTANAISKRVNTQDWHSLLVQACAIVVKGYREPSPTVDLSSMQDEGETTYLLPQLVPEGETTILYGDGDSNKSMLALRIALSVVLNAPLPWGEKPTRSVPVMVLDWETNASTVWKRLRRLAEGMDYAEVPPAIYYRGVTRGGRVLRSLDDELPAIRADIDRLGIGLVIVDSIGFAVTGPLVEDETARAAVNALRLCAPATRLVVAHVSAETARNPGGKARPFGSAFFWNGMRSGIEVRRSEDTPATSCVELGLYHRKTNDSQHHPPIALRVQFADPAGPITITSQDIRDVPDLAARTSLSARIRDMLRTGARDTRYLAERLNAQEDTISKTLKRMDDVMQLTVGGGRGNPSIWGLHE